MGNGLALRVPGLVTDHTLFFWSGLLQCFYGADEGDQVVEQPDEAGDIFVILWFPTGGHGDVAAKYAGQLVTYGVLAVQGVESTYGLFRCAEIKTADIDGTHGKPIK